MTIKNLLACSIIGFLTISCQNISKTPKHEAALVGIKAIKLNDDTVTIVSNEDHSLKLHNAKFEKVTQLTLKKGDLFIMSDHHHWNDDYKIQKIERDKLILQHTHTFTRNGESSQSIKTIVVKPYSSTN